MGVGIKKTGRLKSTLFSNKKGQVTIFIIVSIVIVVGILATIFFMGGVEMEIVSTDNPTQFIKKCVSDVVEGSLLIILENGGMINPTQTITYEDKEYNYLCYQADYYRNCINVHPMLEELIESEILNYTIYDVQNCFNMMRVDFEEKGFSVTGEAATYSIDLLPGKIDISLKKNIVIQREGISESLDNFDVSINTRLYELVMIARDIVNDETTDCNINYNDFALFYPEYKLSKTNYDFSEIYVVGDRKTRDEFKFAVRGCAFAPGI